MEEVPLFATKGGKGRGGGGIAAIGRTTFAADLR